MTYLLITCVFFAIAIAINTTSVYLQKSRHFYDKYQNPWRRHQLVISPLWAVTILLLTFLNLHSHISVSSHKSTGFGVLLVAALLIAASLKTIGLQALTNGNFFGEAKVTKNNIYRYFKNPIYDGYFLLFIAFGLFSGNAVFYILALESFIGLNLIESYFERP